MRKRNRGPYRLLRLLASIAAGFLFVFVLSSCGTTRPITGGSGSTTTATGATTTTVTATTAASTPTTTATTPTATSPATTPGWDSAAVAIPADTTLGTVYVANYNDRDGQSTLFMPEKPLQPTFDGISPDGQDLLYQQTSSGHTMYYRALTHFPNTGFFYELNQSSAGNAIWTADSRTVFVLELQVGVMKVDTQTGQVVNVLALPISLGQGQTVNIGKLTFYRDNYLYFVGAEGGCEDILCRIQLHGNNPTVQKISFRTLGSSFWLSPDGATIYFANKQGPAGEPGIYAVNNDGTNLRLLRQYSGAVPIGYADDNSLVIMRPLNGKFQVVKVGTTPQQDQVLLADAVPGAVSLCPNSNDPQLQGVCDSFVALAPYGHNLMVQGRMADGTFQLWMDNLTTGKQMALTVGGGPTLAHPAQLLGWDKRPTP